jgi:excisionase family DNA binding protein
MNVQEYRPNQRPCGPPAAASPAWQGSEPVQAFFEAFRPLVERTVATVLARVESERQAFSDKLAFSEAEAAALLGVRRHVLRDARLRGEIAGCRVGKSIRYERQELLRFLERRRGL